MVQLKRNVLNKLNCKKTSSVQSRPPTREEDPTLALADGMKSLLRVRDYRITHFRTGSSGCLGLMEWRGCILMSVVVVVS